jgi:DnaJ-class molecular chaperone
VRADPFRDEINIDFPSTGPFIERLREAFLADGLRQRDDTLRAEVLLSSEEAVRGTLLPLDLVLRGTCGACGGRGETWAEPCGECRGTGSSPVRCTVRVPIPPGVAAGARVMLRVRAPNASSVRVEVTVAIKSLRI